MFRNFCYLTAFLLFQITAGYANEENSYPFFDEYISSHDDAQEELAGHAPEQLATLSCAASQLIGGVIHPLSGSPAMREIDLKITGAQEIVLSPVYISPHIPYLFHKYWDRDCYLRRRHVTRSYEGWQLFPHLKIHKKGPYVYVTSPNGGRCKFLVHNGNARPTSDCALSNYGDSPLPSGRFDPRNTNIHYEDGTIVIAFPDGITRYYLLKQNFYLLEKEALPNGKVLRYSYRGLDKPVLVESLDPKERYVYASLLIEGSPEGGEVHLMASNGTKCNYKFSKHFFEGVFRFRDGKRKYTGHTPALMTAASTPKYRCAELTYIEPHCLLQNYASNDKNIMFTYAGFGSEERAHFRVEKLHYPLGKNDTFIPVCSIDYQPAIADVQEGKTTVKNSDGTSIIYHFSKKLLTTAIQFLDPQGELKKEKVFTWDDRNYLASIELKEGNRTVLRKHYEYDQFGNPLKETVEGDLEGKGNLDTYSIYRQFSQEGRHLLTREENEDGKVINYSYLPGTNLVTEKEIKEGEKLFIKETLLYDDCHNLIQKRVSDGKGAALITNYILRQEHPFLHMPEWVEERYLDHGVERLLKRTQLIYDSWGNIAEEKIFDADNKYAYSVFKEYNERGDLLSETNPEGQKKHYIYDDKGRCVEKTHFSQNLHELLSYDAKGRLIESKLCSHEATQRAKFSYDLSDRLISKRDAYDHLFTYSYDPVTHQVTKTESPPIQDMHGKTIPVVELASYDALGRPISKTDANGNTTYFRYNALGLPVEIIHPSGAKEAFTYTKRGKVSSYIDQDGIKTTYAYDILDRLIYKNIDNAGHENFIYDSFNLVAKTDLEGSQTNYFYDGANRKVKEEFCGRATEFYYDSLGRVAAIKNDKQLVRYKRDLRNRICKEEKTDLAGKLLYKTKYSYDVDGHLIKRTRFIHGKKSIEKWKYDAFGREIEKEDPLGNKTSTIYNDQFVLDFLDQRVLECRSTDPKGISTSQIYDAYRRVIKEERHNPQDHLLASWEKVYDPNGNLTLWKEHVYLQGSYQSTQNTYFTYTAENQIASHTRAYSTPESKTVSYTYTLGGRPAAKTLPDGTILKYDYDALGYLRALDSSDGRIRHRFECTKTGKLTKAIDEVAKITIDRTIDAFGNVLQENFPSGIKVAKKYDALDRPTELHVQGIGTISYTYDPLYLRSVSRHAVDGKLRYIHTYDDYDLDGNLLSESLILNCGKATHTWNPKGRKAELSSPFFSEKCRYDASDNLIEKITDSAVEHYTYDDLSQLTNERGNTYQYDSLFNRCEKNHQKIEINSLNERVAQAYDRNGNQLEGKKAQYVYDPLNRLVSALSDDKKVEFTYDPLGRRLSKCVLAKQKNGWREVYTESYLYDGAHEIGAISPEGRVKNFRVLGLDIYEEHPQTVAIELDQQVFAPISDAQNHICRLIDPKSKKIISKYEFSTFGEQLSSSLDDNPWRWAGKRYDGELGLVYFGKRYYDPESARWLTTDPAGFLDSLNLYQFAFNNPYNYYDPNGEFLLCFAIPLQLLLHPIVWKFVGDAIAISIGTYGLYKSMQCATSAAGCPYTLSERMCHDIVSEGIDSDYDLEEEESKQKKKNGESTVKAPPYNGKDLGEDPTKCPGEGFEWRGRGTPNTGKGSWVNTKTGESFHPDLTGSQHKPHWDYVDPVEKEFRLYTDGTWEPK